MLNLTGLTITFFLAIILMGNREKTSADYLPDHKTTVAILLNGWSPGSVAVLNAKHTFNLLF